MTTLQTESKASQSEKKAFPASEVYTLLKKISDADIELMGLSCEYARPDWMILTVLPVPPPPVRPGVAMDGGLVHTTWTVGV